LKAHFSFKIDFAAFFSFKIYFAAFLECKIYFAIAKNDPFFGIAPSKGLNVKRRSERSEIIAPGFIWGKQYQNGLNPVFPELPKKEKT